MPTVKFTFTLKGDIEDLEVYANNERLEVHQNKGQYEENLPSGSTLEVVFEISGDNGTDYTIEYSCKSGGMKKEDPDKPSQVEDRIQHHGYREENLSIII